MYSQYGSVAGGPLQAQSGKLTSPLQFAELLAVPAVVSGVVLLSFAIVFRRDWEPVAIIVAFVAGASVAAAWQFRDIPFRLYASVFCFLGVCLSSVAMSVSYDMALAEYWRMHDSHAYANIIPSEAATDYADAGKVSFADGTSLDNANAMGFKDVHVYCVAPIVDDLRAGVVQFWAVGVDCCPPRGGFDCDDAWNPRARSGVVVNDTTGRYAESVQQAVALYDLGTADNYLLVRWVADPVQVEDNLWNVGRGILVTGFAIQLALLALCALGLNVVLKGAAGFDR